MKNKKIIVIFIAIIIIITSILIIRYKSNKYCELFTGGGYNLIFNTNSKDELEPMNICIACSPDSYEDLPIPKKDGYKFTGWYYDRLLLKRVKNKNTLYINPISKKDWRGCQIGYQDITLYAKWEK